MACLAQCRIYAILSKKIEEPPIQFSIIWKIDIGALFQYVRMPHCHCGGHGFDSRTYRIYCTVGRVDRLQTFNLCKKLRQGFESLRVHILRSSWFLGACLQLGTKKTAHQQCVFSQVVDGSRLLTCRGIFPTEGSNPSGRAKIIYK